MNNKLENKVQDLKDMLTDLLVEKEEMLTSGYQELSASYSQKLGRHETYLYQKEYEYIRLKKKIEMIAYKQKKGQKDIDLYSLDLQLDEDYKDFENRIISRQQMAEESEGFIKDQQLHIHKNSKFRENYWNLVREYHPYLKEKPSFEDKARWSKVNKAFEDKNYYEIENYALSLNYDDYHPSGEKLEELVSYLESKIEDTMTYMDSLKKLHPYNKKALLESIEDINIKKEKINNRTFIVIGKINKLESDLIDLLIK